MRVRMMTNGWIPPVILTGGTETPHQMIPIGTRIEFPIEDDTLTTPIREALSNGYKLELWIEAEV
jgi:hypothetical protein